MGDTGPVRSVLGGPLPPGRSPALRRGGGGAALPGPGVRLRPVAGDLEPGLHAVQPRRQRRHDPAAPPSIDTGMGLERIAAVMQGKLSSCETDLFAPLIARVSELTGKRYGASEDDDVSMRVIADHGRTATFLIADGVTAVQRVARLRAAADHAPGHAPRPDARPHRALPVADGGWVGELMGRPIPRSWPTARASRRRCAGEEERFAETLDSGMRRIEDWMAAPPRRRARPGSRSTGASCSRSTTRMASRATSPRRSCRTRLGGHRGDGAGRDRGRWRPSASARGRARRSTRPTATESGALYPADRRRDPAHPVRRLRVADLAGEAS